MKAIATYHPAAVKRDEPKYAPTFLRDVAKAVRMATGGAPEPEPKVIVDPPTDSRFWWEFAGKTVIAVDIETPRMPRPTRILSAAIASGSKHHEIAGAIDFNLPHLKPKLREALANPDSIKVFQNGAFDIPILEHNGFKVEGPVWDTMLAGYILDPDDYTSLSHLSSIYLDVPPWKHSSLLDPLRYNGLDAAYTLRLYHVLLQKLVETGQQKFFEQHIMPLLREVIIPLNSRGLQADTPAAKRLNTEWQGKLASWKSRTLKHFKDLSTKYGKDIALPVKCNKAGEPIGDSLSSKKTQTLLYDTLGLPIKRNIKTSRPTTDRQALIALEPLDNTGTISQLLERSRLKELETHIKIAKYLGPDNRVRARYVLGGDEKHHELTTKGTSKAKDKGPGTGRLASRDPNHQNVPEECRVIYVPTYPAWWFVEGDSSQIEARLTQHFSQDKGLAACLAEGDIYLYTLYHIDRRTNIYKVSRGGWEHLKDCHKDKHPGVAIARQEAKRAFLGWSYRMGAKKLQLHTGIEYVRAKTILDELNTIFHGVTRYWDEVIARVARDGYLENPFGRRRYFRYPTVEVPKICNFMAQSTAADILFYCQRKLVKALVGKGYLISTIHDANLVEGPDRDKLASAVRIAMESEVPQMGKGFYIPATIKAGRNWRDMETI